MFEVEKKFILSQGEIERLIEGAEFLGERVYTDIYYDNEKLSLSTNDMYLRSRNGKFDLKIPKHTDGGEMNQRYQEVEEEENLRQIFGVVKQGSFLEDILEFGYASFCELKTTRRKFKKEGFVIDLDLVEAQDFGVSIVEIERMVETEAEMPKALLAIENFAKRNGLKSRSVNGKVRAYLKIKKPAHFQAMVDAGVIKE
jgi:adenylate cyclase class IV